MDRISNRSHRSRMLKDAEFPNSRINHEATFDNVVIYEKNMKDEEDPEKRETNSSQRRGYIGSYRTPPDKTRCSRM